VQTSLVSPTSSDFQTFIRDLAGGFASTSLDCEPGDWRDAVARGTQATKSFGQPQPQRADDSGRHNRDAGRQTFPVYSGRCEHLIRNRLAILVAF